MRFGMFDTIRWHEDVSGEDTITNALEQVEFADRLGIQDIWLGEHHFSRHGILSGIFSFMGAVAARTTQARIGTSIVVLPFHNPVQVAEEAAIIDIISNGRFNLGVGAGYQAQEFHGMGRRHHQVQGDIQGVSRRRPKVLGRRPAQLQGRLHKHRKYLGYTQARSEARPSHLHRR